MTLNLCLGQNFDGGDLRFSELRGTDREEHVVGEFAPRRGVALLHDGRHLHKVTEVTGGEVCVDCVGNALGRG